MQGKSDLIEILTTAAKKGETPAYESKTAAERAISSVLEAIRELVAKKGNDGLTIVGFGSFKKVNRAARDGRNPATGAVIKIPKSKTVTFKVSKVFKDNLK